MAGVTPPAWRVTGQQQTNRTDSTNRFVSGVTVFFTTATGHDGSVFVPDAQYYPDMVKSLIAARVAQINAIGGLTG